MSHPTAKQVHKRFLVAVDDNVGELVEIADGGAVADFGLERYLSRGRRSIAEGDRPRREAVRAWRDPYVRPWDSRRGPCRSRCHDRTRRGAVRAPYGARITRWMWVPRRGRCSPPTSSKRGSHCRRSLVNAPPSGHLWRGNSAEGDQHDHHDRTHHPPLPHRRAGSGPRRAPSPHRGHPLARSRNGQ